MKRGDSSGDGFVGWPESHFSGYKKHFSDFDPGGNSMPVAVARKIEFLMQEKHVTRDDAYMLASVAADLHITQLVDGNKGVHMIISKGIFTKAK